MNFSFFSQKVYDKIRIYFYKYDMIRRGGNFNEQQLSLQCSKASQSERNLCSEAKISVVSYT